MAHVVKNVKQEILSPAQNTPNIPTTSIELEMKCIWEYMIAVINNNGIENLEKRLLDEQFWNGYVNATGSTRPPPLLHNLFLSSMDQLPTREFSIDMKIKLYYVYGIPVDALFLDSLQSDPDVTVEMNRERCLTKYRKKGGLEIPKNDDLMEIGCYLIDPTNATLGDSDAEDSKLDISKRQRFRFTTVEELDIWKFLLEKIRAGQSVKPKGDCIWKEYKESRKSNRSIPTLSSRFRKIMAPELHNFPLLDLESKLLLYFSLNLSVPESFLDTLRATGRVGTDELSRIKWYRYERLKAQEMVDQKPVFKTPLHIKKESPKSIDGQTTSDSSEEPLRKSRRLTKSLTPPPVVEADARVLDSGFSPEFQRLIHEHFGPSKEPIVPLKSVRIKEDPEVTDTINKLIADAEGPGPSTSNHSNQNGGEKPADNEPGEFNETEQPTSEDVVPVQPRQSWKSTEYLNFFKTLIQQLDCPDFNAIVKKIDENIEKASNSNAVITVDRLKLIIEANIALVPF